jgi:hypothetical protein
MKGLSVDENLKRIDSPENEIFEDARPWSAFDSPPTLPIMKKASADKFDGF